MGQQNLLYPETFGGFFNHQSLINPAFQQDTGRIVISAAIKSRTGAFKNIATYYASLERSFMNKKNTGHTLRLIFYNEKEGPYIEKPRGYFNYAYRLKLSEKIVLSAGAAIGFVQAAFTVPSATASGVATLPDAALGLNIGKRGVKFGVSSMQLLNNSSPYANFIVKLSRYYNFFLSTEKELNYSWKLKSYALYRLLPEYRDNVDLALLLSYKNILTFGSSARYKQGMSFFTSINLSSGSSIVTLSFAYNTPLLSSVTNLNNSFEIAPVYFLR